MFSDSATSSTNFGRSWPSLMRFRPPFWAKWVNLGSLLTNVGRLRAVPARLRPTRRGVEAQETNPTRGKPILTASATTLGSSGGRPPPDRHPTLRLSSHSSHASRLVCTLCMLADLSEQKGVPWAHGHRRHHCLQDRIQFRPCRCLHWSGH